MSCLYEQIPGFRQKIRNGWFRIRINKQDQSEETLKIGIATHLHENSVIHLIPVICGSGGLVSVVSGTLLAGIGLITGHGWLIGVGIGLAVGGVSSLLSKPPKMDNQNDGSKNNNTSFSSLDNSIAQGSAVPLCYGRMMIGSKVLSQGLEAL